MKYINIIIRSTFHTPTASGWNVVLCTSTGSFPLNYSDGSASPFTLNVTSSNTTTLNNSAYSGGTKHGIPQDVIRATGSYVGGTARVMNISRSDATIVDTVKVWGASATNDAVRQTRWTVEGATYDHDDRNYGDAAPVSITTTGASWPLDFSVVKVPAASFGYPNVIQLEIPDVSYSIVSVNSGNPVKMGQTFNTTTTGFTNVTSGTLGGIALTGVSFSSNTVTATAATLTDGVSIYEPDTSQTLAFTDGTNNASTSITTSSPNLMTSVPVTTPVIANDKYVGYWMAQAGYTPVATDRFVYITADCTVSATGAVSAPDEVVTTIWLWQNSGDMARSFTVTINEDGVVSVVHNGMVSLGVGFGIGI